MSGTAQGRAAAGLGPPFRAALAASSSPAIPATGRRLSSMVSRTPVGRHPAAGATPLEPRAPGIVSGAGGRGVPCRHILPEGALTLTARLAPVPGGLVAAIRPPEGAARRAIRPPSWTRPVLGVGFPHGADPGP